MKTYIIVAFWVMLFLLVTVGAAFALFALGMRPPYLGIVVALLMYASVLGGAGIALRKRP